MAKNPILLVGSIAGNAIEVLETALACGFDPVVVALEGQTRPEGLEGFSLHDLPERLKGYPATVAGSRSDPDLRFLRIDSRWRIRSERQVAEAEAAGIINWVSLVHPSSSVSPSAHLGKGVFVGPLVSVSSASTVGDFTHIGRGSTIGHHVDVGTFSQLGPGVVMPGYVTVGSGVTVGPGVVFLNSVTVGDNSLIGAGSIVTRSVRSGRQAMGNPARTRLNPASEIRRSVPKFAKRLLWKIGLFDVAKRYFGKRRT
jgi:acetyltransferase-like isoleucine patch superfamily enzyme